MYFRGGGIVVAILTFYSEQPSLNSAQVNRIVSVKCFLTSVTLDIK